MARIKEELLPLNSKALDAINCDSLDLSKEIVKLQRLATKMAKNAQRLSDHDAVMLYCTKEVRGIKAATTQANMYLGIASMLLEHIKDDLVHIYRERDQFRIEREEQVRRQQDASRKHKQRSKEAAETE